MTKNIVKAMQETGVKRIIAISSIGIYVKPMKPILKPYRALADVTEAFALQQNVDACSHNSADSKISIICRCRIN